MEIKIAIVIPSDHTRSSRQAAENFREKAVRQLYSDGLFDMTHPLLLVSK